MNSKAFTLIELLIVLAVAASLSMVGIATYGTLNKEKALTAQTEQFIQTLELAKKKINVGDKLRCPATLNDYSVMINSATSYSLVAGCSTGDITIASYQFPSNSSVSFTDYSLSETVFTPLAGGSTANCVAISETKLNKCRVINVNTSGLISEVGGDCTCP